MHLTVGFFLKSPMLQICVDCCASENTVKINLKIYTVNSTVKKHHLKKIMITSFAIKDYITYRKQLV